MAQYSPTRILVADDHYMVRKGLAFFLKAFNDLQLVGEAVNGVEAVEMCAALHPNVILMDLMMPEMDGVEATRLIRDRYPDVRVIALTSMEVDADMVNTILQAGASHFVRKQTSINDIVELIRDMDFSQQPYIAH